MGYRSDIVIALKQEVITRNLLTNEIPKIVLESFNRKDENVDNSLTVYYYYLEGFKWYTEYPEVLAVEDWLNSMNYEEFGAVRLGEDFEDVEYWGNPGEFNIYPRQHIEF